MSEFDSGHNDQEAAATMMGKPRVAHALCPYCYTEDPRETIPEGTSLTRWCGEVVPLSYDPVTVESEFCTACGTPDSECSGCGAKMTFLGVLPPPSKED